MRAVTSAIETLPRPRPREGLLADMWRDRKRVFVDMLNWDVPVEENAFEIDQFDDEHAQYMVVSDETRSEHLASVRLLPTERPHILSDVFPQLCAGPIPRGRHVWEITRLCISPSVGFLRESLRLRQQIAIGSSEFALANGVTHFTNITLVSHLPQVVAVGWDAEPLGYPQRINGMDLVATLIEITPAVLERIRSCSGIKRRLLTTPQEVLARAA